MYINSTAKLYYYCFIVQVLQFRRHSRPWNFGKETFVPLSKRFGWSCGPNRCSSEIMQVILTNIICYRSMWIYVDYDSYVWATIAYSIYVYNIYYGKILFQTSIWQCQTNIQIGWGDARKCNKQYQTTFSFTRGIGQVRERLAIFSCFFFKNQLTIFFVYSRKYSAIVFIASLRFETAKRRLQYLNFSDFYECAQAIMTYWTYTYQHSGPEYYDTEMDREFLLDLRELRCLLDKEKEIKQ